MKVVITAGGTEEKIDEIRSITNMSSGKLGIKICNKLTSQGFKNLEVFYICHKNSIMPNFIDQVNIIKIINTNDIQKAIKKTLKENKIDFFIHLMAISDYSVEGAYTMNDKEILKIDTSSKMRSSEDEIYLKLIKTPKIINQIKKLSKKTKLISFKLLNNVSTIELLKVGSKQLEKTKSDLVVANDLKNIRKGNHIALMIKDEFEEDSSYDIVDSKKKIAKYIVSFIKKRR